jgi:hypothetical protein
VGIGGPDDQSLADVNMAAASLHADNLEIQALLRELVSALGDVLGSRIQVDYSRGFFGKLIGDLPYINPRSRTIRAVTLLVGVDEFRLHIDGRVHCRIDRVPGTGPSGAGAAAGAPAGSPAEGKELTLPQWAGALLAALNEQAQINAESRQALESLVAS